jgi:hypothetical protein
MATSVLSQNHLLVTEGASRNARMGKTRKEAIEIPKPDN